MPTNHPPHHSTQPLRPIRWIPFIVSLTLVGPAVMLFCQHLAQADAQANRAPKPSTTINNSENDSTKLQESDVTVTPTIKSSLVSPKMMPNYLSKHAHVAFDTWRKTYENLKSADDVTRYQKAKRESFLNALGQWPPKKTPLNAKITGTIERDDLTIQKLLFESRPNFFVSALVFVPKNKLFKAPYPGVAVTCGHSSTGKGYEGYQAAAALLAKNGIVAVLFDPISQGERLQRLDKTGKPLRVGSTTEHTLVGVRAMLLGQNTAGIMIHDGMRALDYLQSRDDVDPKRLGVMGNSGGGTQSSYIMALDPRIKAGSPSCYITTFERLLATIGPQDAEQVLYGQLANGLDHPDYLIMRAPKPTLLCTATKDFFSIDGAWKTFRDAKRIYSRLGQPEAVDLVEHDAKHGYAAPLREAAVRFMVRWLNQQENKPVLRTEPAFINTPYKPLVKEEYWVTEKGGVMTLPHAKSAFDYLQDDLNHAKTKRSKNWKDSTLAQRQAIVKQALSMDGISKNSLPGESRGKTIERGSLTIRQFCLFPEEGIALPMAVISPMKKPAEHLPAVLMMHEQGKSKLLDQAQALANKGHIVAILDPRGVGQTHPGNRRWYNPLFGPEGRDVMTAYLLKKSYPQMRTRDILAAIDWLSRINPKIDPVIKGKMQPTPQKINVVAHGNLAIPALHAAFLNHQKVATLQTIGGLQSWEVLFADPSKNNHVVNLVHGILLHYDLPDLRQSLEEAGVDVKASFEK